jgi:hypothetical protein
VNTPPYAELYDSLVDATGTTPGTKLAEDLERLYQRHPATFAAKTGEVIAAWNAGRITSPWPFLRSALQRIDDTRPTAEAPAAELEKAVRLAETWIRNAGLYTPFDELESELFEKGGRLEPWANDTALRARITDYWRAQRPRVRQAEHEKIERAEAWKKAQKKLAEAEAK